MTIITEKTILDDLFTQRTKSADLANKCKDNIKHYTHMIQSMAETYVFEVLESLYKTSGRTYLEKEEILKAIKMEEPRFTEEDMLGGLRMLDYSGKATLHFEDEQDGGRIQGIELRVEKK